MNEKKQKLETYIHYDTAFGNVTYSEYKNNDYESQDIAVFNLVMKSIKIKTDKDIYLNNGAKFKTITGKTDTGRSITIRLFE